MKSLLLSLCLFCCLLASAQVTEECAAPSKNAALYDEAQLKADYDDFLEGINALKIATAYPGAVKLLLSSKPEKQIIGIRMVQATHEIEILPWLVPVVQSSSRRVRIEALLAIGELATHYTLQRRDASRSEGVFIKSLGPKDPDLTPLAWLVLQQLRQSEDAPNMRAYAATIAGYLNLDMFTKELEALLLSRHPAIGKSAKYALRLIGEGHLE